MYNSVKEKFNKSSFSTGHRWLLGAVISLMLVTGVGCENDPVAEEKQDDETERILDSSSPDDFDAGFAQELRWVQASKSFSYGLLLDGLEAELSDRITVDQAAFVPMDSVITDSSIVQQMTNTQRRHAIYDALNLNQTPDGSRPHDYYGRPDDNGKYRLGVDRSEKFENRALMEAELAAPFLNKAPMKVVYDGRLLAHGYLMVFDGDKMRLAPPLPEEEMRVQERTKAVLMAMSYANAMRRTAPFAIKTDPNTGFQVKRGINLEKLNELPDQISDFVSAEKFYTDFPEIEDLNKRLSNQGRSPIKIAINANINEYDPNISFVYRNKTLEVNPKQRDILINRQISEWIRDINARSRYLNQNLIARGRYDQPDGDITTWFDAPLSDRDYRLQRIGEPGEAKEEFQVNCSDLNDQAPYPGKELAAAVYCRNGPLSQIADEAKQILPMDDIYARLEAHEQGVISLLNLIKKFPELDTVKVKVRPDSFPEIPRIGEPVSNPKTNTIGHQMDRGPRGIGRVHAANDYRIEYGQPIQSMFPRSFIVKKGHNGGCGLYIVEYSLEHLMTTVSCHGSDWIDGVDVGDIVGPFAKVMRGGSSGASTGPHAHVELRIGSSVTEQGWSNPWASGGIMTLNPIGVSNFYIYEKEYKAMKYVTKLSGKHKEYEEAKKTIPLGPWANEMLQYHQDRKMRFMPGNQPDTIQFN